MRLCTYEKTGCARTSPPFQDSGTENQAAPAGVRGAVLWASRKSVARGPSWADD
ncbi:predicted protein [Chaetomium globosum CBS 148.51]|uniref:Uncharacterized protein n=1 Tax=Chaetomium globosum (strain ATCC 6205 / CBS 148.51 / DSM 1962 / NBRC 6347 / NRRL 1970) TaxID=306901 RepID=Q2H4G7_CHAGB|nr:uncharacterized protein CHGG_06448 [Chaetomium globosum CBS 148.51]EAQ89829.1 predicted protein [Chaetomium globosum CBS 148.51]